MLKRHLVPLQHSRGLEVAWRDQADIPGSDWTKQIEDEISRSSVFVILVSPDYLSSIIFLMKSCQEYNQLQETRE